MAEGDIGAEKATLEFDGGDCYAPKIIHISGEVCAIAYSGPDSVGWLKTIKITALGALSLVVGGSLEFDEVDGTYPSIIHISGDVYAIAYQGVDSHGWIKTFTIDSDGAIAAVGGGALRFDTENGIRPDIIHISGEVYAIAYEFTGNVGKITTMKITALGAISTITEGFLVYDDVSGTYPSIVHVSGDVYAVAYGGPTDTGCVRTVTIDSAGAIAEIGEDPHVFEVGSGLHPNIIHVSGNVYAIAYTGPGTDGWIKTVTITPAGEIAAIEDGFLEFDTSYGSYPSIVHVSGNAYAIAYRYGEYDGRLRTITIPTNGVITDGIIDTLESTQIIIEPNIIHVSGDIYAIVHTGPDDDGWVRTVDIETIIPPPVSRHMMMMGIG